MSVRSWTAKEWVASAIPDRGAYWRDSDGDDHEVIVDADEPTRVYALRGHGVGSLLVIGAGAGDAWRDGAGDGDARRDGDGAGDARRDGAGDGGAWRYGAGDGDAWRDGAGDGDARRDGAGAGREHDSRGIRSRICATGIRFDVFCGGGALRVGCELHPLATWVAEADAIDARHGEGIAHLTRELAQRLLERAQS